MSEITTAKYIIPFVKTDKGFEYRIFGPIGTPRNQNRTCRMTNLALLPAGPGYDIVQQNGGGFYGLPKDNFDIDREPHKEALIVKHWTVAILAKAIERGFMAEHEELMPGTPVKMEFVPEDVTNNPEKRKEFDL